MSQVCAAMGCYRQFTPAPGKVFHAVACARRDARRRREREYRALTVNSDASDEKRKDIDTDRVTGEKA